MNTIRKLALLSNAVGLAMLIGLGSASAQLSSDDQKCIDQYNNKAWKIAKMQGKNWNKCVKDAGKDPPKENDPEGCLTADAKGKVEKMKVKTHDKVAAFCDNTEPIARSWDAGGENARTTASAHEQGVIDLAHDVFGPDHNVAVVNPGKQESKCQDKVAKRAGKIVEAKLKEFRGCKKDGMKDGSINNEEELRDNCMDPLPDFKGKIGKAELKLSDDVDKQCKPLTPDDAAITTLFPGECKDEATWDDFKNCVEARVECRVCQILNRADGLTRDCDDFDDGVDNDSCPVGDPHKCVLDPLNSRIDIFTQLPFPLNLISLAASGSIDISCGEEDPQYGKAGCECEIQTFDELVIPGLGTVCITPSGVPCPLGEVDCDGGNSMDIDMVSDGDIMVDPGCTSNAQCEAACRDHCRQNGREIIGDGGCTGFCEGGANDALPCTMDTDCPAGSCNGQDGAEAEHCQCDCVDLNAGPPSPAGAMQCSMPTKLVVEGSPPCADPPGSGDTLIDVPPACIPLTTTFAQTVQDGAGPFSGTGTSIPCDQLRTSDPSGTRTIGVQNFFGSTIGDLRVLMTFECL